MSEAGFQKLSESQADDLFDLAADREAELLPELEDWVEEGEWGRMLRHPLVYHVPLFLPGQANKALLAKQAAVRRAIEEEDWHSMVFLHERPYRLMALLRLTGTDEEEKPLPLVHSPEHWELAASVWVDSENIQQNIEDWRALFGPDPAAEGLWLGDEEERDEFDNLPREVFADRDGKVQEHIQAWRGGTVGDWSWTTDRKIAEFFSRRSGAPVRGYKIPVADVFGYLTRRGEAELLVKFTEFRRTLVYPEVSGNQEED